MTCLGVTGEVSELKQFEWKIADFFSLSAESGSLSFYNSPSFVFDNTSLHLCIYPGGYRRANSGFISVYLVNDTDPLDVNYSLHIKKADGTLIGGRSHPSNNPNAVGLTDFYNRSNLEQNKSELVPLGILTIVCIRSHNADGSTLQADAVEMSTPGTSDFRRLTELDVLSENLREFSADKDSCDVVLEVEDKEFKAHKAILMARSSVFAAMFRHDTLEKQTGIIKISDCDSESFQEFLDYLYCGQLEEVSFHSAFHLYSTACKYDIQKLKEFCIKYLIENLTTDNLCDIVQLADKFNETKLIAETQRFFNENMIRIFPTAEWKNLITNYTNLANHLLVEFSKTKSSQ